MHSRASLANLIIIAYILLIIRILLSQSFVILQSYIFYINLYQYDEKEITGSLPCSNL